MRLSPRVLVVFGVLAFVVVLVAIGSAGQPGTKQVQDGVVTQIIGTSTADAQVTFPVSFSEGDPEHESTHVFEALTGVPGVVRASVYTQSAEVLVEYASAEIDEATVRKQLVNAGYVKATAADMTPAVMAEDGKTQRIEIADSGGFNPAYIRAKAGVPLQLAFAAGTECRVRVKFPELQREADITQPTVVDLGALKAGTYTILCGQDAPEGTIVVE